MSRYIPQPAYADMMPVDISFVFADEKPAGKRGFVHSEGENFYFEDGTLVRFWGVNLNGAACFPEKDYAPKVARRLAQAGCNIVRLHQLDTDWGVPNIFTFTQGRRVDSTRQLDPQSMDRLDYLIYCLKQEGIYCYLDMLTYRRFKEKDGVHDLELLDYGAKPWCIVDPWLIQLQMEYCTQMWTHFNPYTGLAYKDDPVFVMVEMSNECDLFITRKNAPCPYYINQFRTMFRDWLQEHGIDYDWENCDLYAPDKPLIDFKLWVTDRYYKQMYTHMRDTLGLKIPITGTNWTYTSACVKLQEMMDYTDSHTYFKIWNWTSTDRTIAHRSITSVPSVFPELGKMKIAGKPFFISEWDMPWPNSFRAESPLYFAAVAALQNWSGATVHTYAYTSRMENIHVLGRELTTGAAGYTYREGAFSTWNDPAKFGLFYHAALITRRGDVSPAKEKVAVKAVDLSKTITTAFQGLLEQHQAATSFGDELPEGYETLVDESKQYEVPDRWVSDNGQLWRDLKTRIGAVDTPMTKAVYGFIGKHHTNLANNKPHFRPICLEGLTIEAKTDFGTIALSSLTDESICDSKNILISAIGRARNTNAEFDGTKMVNLGEAPILAEVVEAELRLRTSRGMRLKLWAINPEGYYAGKIPVSYEDGELVFRIGDEMNPACYYLLVED